MDALYVEDLTTGCWVWQGSIDEYGYAKHNGQLTHRSMWELLKGPIPPNLFLLHSCDNKRCVCPSHMFIGTHQDNMDDMAKKNRRVTVQRKLNKEDVVLIRAAHADGKLIKDLAIEYSISYRHMRRVVNGYRWRDDTSTPRKY